jgi:hypothetical protein
MDAKRSTPTTTYTSPWTEAYTSQFNELTAAFMPQSLDFQSEEVQPTLNALDDMYNGNFPVSDKRVFNS